MAKELSQNDFMGLVGDASINYIQGISDGNITHDIAVKNGITFYNGSGDNTGVKWDGVQALEVVIPTLADIVANPVVLKGVANSDNNLPATASDGDLWYIGTAGVYNGQACEAGDMAIYYNKKWNFISGENQVTINASAGTTTGNDTVFSISGVAKTILDVEGKTLSLAIDYADVAAKTKVEKGALSLSVTNGTVAVGAMNIGLTYTSSASQDIATEKSIALPTALSNGAVTIGEKVLTSDAFTFVSGSLPTISKNAASISINASTDISVTGTFLTGGSAIGSASIIGGTSSDNDIAYVTGLSAVAGTNFVTNIRAYDAQTDVESDVKFEIPGAVTVTGTSTFATKFGEAANSGDVVSSIVVGGVTIGNGSDVVTGLSGEGTSVVTSVTIGSAVQDTTAEWFVNGLSDNGNDVVADVAVGEVSLVSGDTAGLSASAIMSASVSNHVLSFNTGSFMKPVQISQANSTITKKGFTKAGVKLTGFDSASDTLTFGGISQAETAISYKSLETSSINISLGSATKYVLTSAADHAYKAEMGYAKLSTEVAEFETGSPSLTNTAIRANIPAGAVAVDITGGALPSLSIGAATGTLTGTVDTALNITNISWLAVDPEKRNIAGAGAYALTSDMSAAGLVGSAISVASAGTYSLDGANVPIAAGNVVTDVYVNDSVVGNYIQPTPEE